MFGKKKKDIEVIGKQEGERQKNINEPKFKIKVYKSLGRETYQEIDSFYANQKKDNSGSMFLVNQEHNFKESLAVSKNEEIVKLKDRLDIKKLPIEKQREVLDRKIEKQEDKVRHIIDGVLVEGDKKIKVNSIEEDKKLRQLKVLKYVMNHTDE